MHPDGPQEPEAYERECLRLLLEYFKWPGNSEMTRSNTGRIFVGADLEDSYPYTQLVVHFIDDVTGAQENVKFSIWSDVWVADVPGIGPRRFRPRGMIEHITTNLEEPNRPWKGE